MRRLVVILFVSLAAASTAVSEAAAAQRWHPAAGTSFSIVLSVAPTTVTTPAQVVDLDLFDTKSSTIAALKRQGKRVLCYFSAGSWENWRPDKNAFPANVLGNPLDGWPGERWLDIRKLNLLAAPMRTRLDLCKRKGFDGVDPDNVDGFNANTGFPLARVHAINYLRFLASEAHARGLAIGLKNATEIAATLLPVMDFAVTEDCFKQGWCRVSKNFIAQNKPVFAIEYTDNRIDFAAFCRQAKANGLSPLLKRRNLDTWERRCP
jgi:hypothetical protein